MKPRWITIVAQILAYAFIVGAVLFVGWGSLPEHVGDRIWIVVLALAVIGIPLGIWLGTQEKFYL